ncbi:hypothetical protein, partial [Bradyrhizobium retamae]|uniref:hypothetical protein n=1 Tax=Bradyrhizobium retamae TaxID=1300035 RepID=UPI001AECFDC8
RHPAMIQLLVSPTANEESANNPSVPSIQPAAARGFHGIGRLVVTYQALPFRGFLIERPT